MGGVGSTGETGPTGVSGDLGSEAGALGSVGGGVVSGRLEGPLGGVGEPPVGAGHFVTLLGQ